MIAKTSFVLIPFRPLFMVTGFPCNRSFFFASGGPPFSRFFCMEAIRVRECQHPWLGQAVLDILQSWKMTAIIGILRERGGGDFASQTDTLSSLVKKKQKDLPLDLLLLLFRSGWSRELVLRFVGCSSFLFFEGGIDLLNQVNQLRRGGRTLAS